MVDTLSSALAAALSRLLRPLVRLCLRNGLPYPAFADLVKREFVRVATSDFGLPDKRPTKARVSILTGLSRKEVNRVLDLPEPHDAGAADRYNRAARVIAGWLRDPDFAEPVGGPARLSYNGGEPSFYSLVRRYSGDMPPRALLDELLHVGAAEQLGDGTVRLRNRVYVPTTGSVEKLAILGTDVADLITTIDHNLQAEPGSAYLQRKVAYNNLPEEAIAFLRPMAARQAQALIEELDAWFSQHDRDLTPAVAGTGRKRAGIGIYYFEQDYLPEGASAPQRPEE